MNEDVLVVRPLDAPPDATVELPGSKSITNRALICAALAEGSSRIEGALVSDDTEAMLGCLGVLGVNCEVDPGTAREDSALRRPSIEVHRSGAIESDGAVLDARLSGTTARFIAPVCVLGGGTCVLDGAASLRNRPMGDLLEALEHLGAGVRPLGAVGHLPVELSGGGGALRGSTVRVRGDTSSQFLTGLLLAAPLMPGGLDVSIDGPLVSRPYVDMTVAVMGAFGAEVRVHGDGERLERIEVAASGYRACEFVVEPDASAGSYFFALAAASGGRVRVDGLGAGSLQGDLAFVEVLGSMGAAVEVASGHTEVRGTGSLHGVDVDMVDISDTAPTLAAIAPVATTPTTVRGIGFARGKETDRIAAVVTELNRLGITATQSPDGFEVHSGGLTPAVVRTYHDHRMAMSFGVLGLLADGVSIADPGCVDKTFPGFWDTVESLR